MYTLNNPKESEETIFLQAIDQIYEINKNYSDSSEDDSNEDYENGKIKLNFDFIDILDESLFSKSKNDGKKSEENLFNSSLNSESTEFESFNVSRFISEKFLTEPKGLKIKDFLASKLTSNKKIDLEIQNMKESLRSNYEVNEKLSSSKSHLSLTAFKHNLCHNSNHSNNTLNHFNLNYNCNFPNQQNFNCNSFICMPPQTRNATFNSVYNNFQVGFFQQTSINNKKY